MGFLIGYFAANALVFFVWMLCLASICDACDDIPLVYPQIFQMLDDADVNLAGKISLSTLITIIFAPAIAAYLFLVAVAITTYVLVHGSWILFCKIFKKRRKDD